MSREMMKVCFDLQGETTFDEIERGHLFQFRLGGGVYMKIEGRDKDPNNAVHIETGLARVVGCKVDVLHRGKIFIEDFGS